jgi:hypothetical protein
MIVERAATSTVAATLGCVRQHSAADTALGALFLIGFHRVPS